MDSEDDFMNNDQGKQNLQENIVMKILQDSMNDPESERYYAYRSSKVPDTRIKKTIQQNLGNVSLNELASVIIRTASKVYVGEMIEEAKIYMSERNESGPIQPFHLAEAKRRLAFQNKDLSHEEFQNLFY